MTKTKLRHYAKDLGIDAGCMDSGCIWGPPDGMCTNGGCRCLGNDAPTARIVARKLARVASHVVEKLETVKW